MAGIPSLSYYPDAETHSAGGTFPTVRTVGDIDAMRGFKYAVRLDRDGKPVGCVVCESNICDSVLEPCLHAFCNACIRYRMRRGIQTICVLCSKSASKVIISSAPMETPALGNAATQQETAAPTPTSTDLASTSAEIQHCLPSLRQMAPFSFTTDTSTKLTQQFIEQLLMPDEFTSELRCRLAVAQILKDIDFPWEPLPPCVQAAANAVMSTAVRWASNDTVDLLLSLGIDVNSKQYPGDKSLLEQACAKIRPREYVAKRLIDEGCDWSTIEGDGDGDMPEFNFGGDGDGDMPGFNFGGNIQQKILEYARQQEKMKQEIEVTY